MSNVERYKQYAADCMRQANNEASQDDRTLLLNVALAWLRLARQTETMGQSAGVVIAAPGQREPAKAEMAV